MAPPCARDGIRSLHGHRPDCAAASWRRNPGHTLDLGKLDPGCTAADMTARCAFKIEDPSQGPGRVHFTAPDEGFGFEGTPRPKIQRDPYPQKGNLVCGTPAVVSGTRKVLSILPFRFPAGHQAHNVLYLYVHAHRIRRRRKGRLNPVKRHSSILRQEWAVVSGTGKVLSIETMPQKRTLK